MSQCITPLTIRDKSTNEAYVVPCSKCPNCLKRRASGWSFRLLKEAENSHSALWFTLTYDTDHVPITKKRWMSLSKSDFQNFVKRLRKLRPKGSPPVKYFVVGEYGGQSARPHYHCTMFNCTHDDVIRAWCLGGKPLGNVHFGDVSGASIGYTLKYMMKEPAHKIPLHKNDDRIKEFALMSKD